MKAVVAIKRTVDHAVHPRIQANGVEVETSGVKMSTNPFDEIALEEALRLRERGIVNEIVAVTIGSSASHDVLRQALAMGVDRAMLIETDVVMQPLGVAKILRAIVQREQPGLILLGKQAIDDDAAQTGQMLAALLDVGQGTFASAVDVKGDEVWVRREVEGGSEVVALKLPTVITTDLRLNEPRFVKLPNLMLAKKKPIETVALADLKIDATPRLKQIRLSEPPQRQRGIRVGNVAELVEKLRHTGVLQ